MQKQTLTIVCYLALTACFSAFFWTLMIASGHVGAGKGLYVAGLMWCPAAAATATCYIRRVDFNALGLRWGGARYASTFLLHAACLRDIGYALIWIFGFGFFPDPGAIAAIAGKARLDGHQADRIHSAVSAPHRHDTNDLEPCARFGRGNRLARPAHAADGATSRLHQGQHRGRHDLGGVAHAALAVRGLQQRNAVVVLDALLLRADDWMQRHHDVVPPGFQQRLALRNTAREPQLIHSRFFHTLDRISRHPDRLCDR